MVDVAGSTLGSLLWMMPIVVAEVGAVFTGLGAVVLRVSIIATNFALEVRTHGVYGSVDQLLTPLLHFLDEEVQFGCNHICLLDDMHAFGAGLESFITPPLIGDYFLDQFFGFRDGQVEKGSSSISIDIGS